MRAHTHKMQSSLYLDLHSELKMGRYCYQRLNGMHKLTCIRLWLWIICFTLYTAFDHIFYTSFFISIADLGTRPIGVTVLCTHTLLSLSPKLRDQYILTWDTIPHISIQSSCGYHSPPLTQVSTLPLPGLLSSLANHRFIQTLISS